MESQLIKLYFDYKSPFAYLAKDEAFKIEEEYRVQLQWLPYVLNIPEALGDMQTRTQQQWRKVRYLYMDARRWANKRGLTIKGPQKIFDSSIAAIGMLYAQKQEKFRSYHDRMYERFWTRAIDIEDKHAVASLLVEVGVDAKGFLAYLDGEGRADLAVVQQQAETDEVFGVPIFIVEGEMFWGYDRVPLVRDKLDEMGLRK
jgi:2-hydroxychromene-2-carboxylate isomerase